MKTFLAVLEQVDGEHEHCMHCIVNAKDIQTAQQEVEKSLTYDNCNLDTEDSIWGFGDSLTHTKFRSLRPIPAEEAEILLKHNVVSASLGR